MAIYRSICRGEKPDDAAHLHREMKNALFRHAAGSLAGALAMLAAGVAYAATLNQSLRIAPEAPLWLVADTVGAAATAGRLRTVQVAEAGRRLPAVGSSETPATAAEIVGRMLAPGPSNPDVPLPHPDLSEKFSDRTGGQEPLKGPTPYGRGETGGGILGFRVPIPVERSNAGGTTTSSPVAVRPESPSKGASRP